jgi:hypothetical protein
MRRLNNGGHYALRQGVKHPSNLFVSLVEKQVIC